MRPRDVAETRRDPQVVGVALTMPVRLVEPFAVEAAATEGTWGIGAVGADRSPFTGPGVTVAVLDTGIDAAHPAFAGVELVARDFSGSGDGDRNGHGTHCAGTIFGRDVEGQRIGVARGVGRALIGKVLADDGRGGTDMIFGALTWAIQNDADVISMSLGLDFPGMVASLVEDGLPADLATSIALEGYRGNLRLFDALMQTIRARAAFGDEIVVVAAAGNESRRRESLDYEIAAGLPAAAEGVVSVGAAEPGDGGFRIAAFSNTLPIVTAPGVNILSARVGGGLRALSGTSMACPHVAGVVALLWEELRGASVPQAARNVIARLLAGARADVFASGVDVGDRGNGMVTAPGSGAVA
jgi:subtilisin family serine protease